ncbi:transglycosylase domain-containing protein [Longirhabdus pacifica]|uniref:transglycosylase domain-containing protein n=1 Tax=Longirhabdus pacifica TaxID=2305227 RepID=UPI001008F9E7|nr:transglycosylase domain-containing protein [Longirhabdus pacifica]
MTESKKTPGKKSSSHRGRKIGKIAWTSTKWLFAILFVVGFFAAGAVYGFVTDLVKDDPVRSKELITSELYKDDISGFVYFNDDSLVGQLRTDEDRRLAEWNEIPNVVIDAFLATEDKNFFEHIGVNFQSTARAVMQQVNNDPVTTGGSTITQQFVRRTYGLGFEESYARKAKEILLAMRVERYLSKEQIFLGYLNKIAFGNGSSGYNVSGIKAAAEGIFNIKNLDNINIAQAAYLAGLPQNPTTYSAFDGYGQFREKNFEYAIQRQQLVLGRMLEENKITQAEYDEAMQFDIKASLAASKPRAYSTYPFLMIEVEQRAAKLLLMQNNPDLTYRDLSSKEYEEQVNEAIQQLQTGGYKIHTTIDKDLYRMMQDYAKNPENFTPDQHSIEADDYKNGVEQVGAVMIDNNTGAIISMIEGRDYGIEEYNHATTMVRQPGSTMKTIGAFLPALEVNAISTNSTIDDIPIILSDGSKGAHIPQNWDQKYHGFISMRTAVNQSYNIPAIYLYNYVLGIDNAWKFAESLGITTLEESDYNAQTGVIGGLARGVSVEELSSAYSAIPAYGQYKESYMIEKITDANGEIIYEHKVVPERVFSAQTAADMTSMLSTVISGGTGGHVRRNFDHYNEIQIAGKTGSTQEDRDAWYMGYTPDITFGVWAGFDDNDPIPAGQGRNRAMDVWANVMDLTIEMKPELFANKTFPRPEDVVDYTNEGTASSVLDGDFPKINAKGEKEAVTFINVDGLNYLPQAGTPSDMLREGDLITNRTGYMYGKEASLQEILEEIKSLPYGVRSLPIERYHPSDSEDTAPMEEDPREEDGNNPNPPASVSLTEKEGNYLISFSESASPDVAGYRLYRAIDDGEYTLLNSILLGDSTSKLVYPNPSRKLSYVIRTVDIAGNESENSNVVDNLPYTDIEDPENEGDGYLEEDENNEDNQNSDDPNDGGQNDGDQNGDDQNGNEQNDGNPNDGEQQENNGDDENTNDDEQDPSEGTDNDEPSNPNGEDGQDEDSSDNNEDPNNNEDTDVPSDDEIDTQQPSGGDETSDNNDDDETDTDTDTDNG